MAEDPTETDIRLVEHSIARLGLSDDLHFHGVPLKNITSRRKVPWSRSDERTFNAHLARYQLGYSNFKTHKFEELAAALDCTRSPEYLRVMTPKIQSSLAYRLKKLEREGHVSLGDRDSDPIWMPHTLAWSQPDWDGNTTPRPIQVRFPSPQGSPNTDTDADPMDICSVEGDAPDSSQHVPAMPFQAAEGPAMPAEQVHDPSSPVVPRTPQRADVDHRFSSVIWPGDSPSNVRPPARHGHQRAATMDSMQTWVMMTPGTQTRSRGDQVRSPRTPAAQEQYPMTPRNIQIDPRLLAYGVFASGGGQTQSRPQGNPTQGMNNAPNRYGTQQVESPRPRSLPTTRTPRHRRPASPEPTSPVATPKRLATSEDHIRRALDALQGTGGQTSLPVTPSRRLRFPTPARNKTTFQARDRDVGLSESLDLAMMAINTSYDELPAVLAAHAQLRFRALKYNPNHDDEKRQRALRGMARRILEDIHQAEDVLASHALLDLADPSMPVAEGVSKRERLRLPSVLQLLLLGGIP